MFNSTILDYFIAGNKTNVIAYIFSVKYSKIVVIQVKGGDR